MNTDKAIKERITIKNIFMNFRSAVLLAVIALICIVLIALYPSYFPTWGNVCALLLTMSFQIMIVVGMALTLINGEIDLSVGYNMSFSGVLCAYMIANWGLPYGWSILVTLVLAIGFGALIGFLVGKVQINSFISTLAMGMVFNGLALVISRGKGIYDLPQDYLNFGQGSFLGLQLPVWYACAIALAFIIMVPRMTFFKNFFFVGTNKKAASLSGINVTKIKISSYVLCSLFASFAGIVSAARFGNAMPSVGTGIEMKVITAAVIGGISFTGGVGSIFGAVLGVIFLTLISNMLNLSGMNQFLQPIIVGLIMLGAIVSDTIIAKKRI